MKRHSSAFTLIELLVVISIIALLVAMLLPALQSARGSAMSITCQTQLRTIGQASHMYATDWQGYFPACYMYNTPRYADGGLDYFWPRRDLEHYLGVTSRGTKAANKTLVCPIYEPETVNKAGSNYFFSYTYNGHYGLQNADLTWPSDGLFYRPDQLNPGKSIYAGGPSDKAFIVDGTKDGVSGSGLPQTSIYERETFMPYGFSSGNKGIMNFHVGESNNWGFFDGHVENRLGAAMTGGSPPFLRIWYLYW